MTQLNAQPSDSVSLSHPSIAQGVLHRLILPIVAFFFLMWCGLYLLCAAVLMPNNDFGRMLYATKSFTEGKDMYACTKATPAHLEANDHYTVNLYEMNPPHLHALLLPFTLLNDDHACMLWWVLSGLCLFHALRWTMAELEIDLTPQQRNWALVMLVTFAATTALIPMTQLSFVLMIPITLMWLAARRGLWGWSGAVLGLALSVKPFLAVFLPYYLWQRHYRALAACLGTTLLCFTFGILVFGWDSHLAWQHRLAESSGWACLPMNASLTGFLTRTFAHSVLFIPVMELSSGTIWAIWLTVGGALGMLAIAATRGGRNGPEVDGDFTLLLASAIFFCPLGWTYYLWLLLPPLAGMWQAGRRSQDSHPWIGRALLTVCAMTFAWPVPYARVFQPYCFDIRHGLPDAGFRPEAIATFFIGNVYVWGLLALWIYLVRDSLARKKEPLPALAHRLPPLERADYRLSVVMPVFSETDSVRQVAGWLLDNLGPELEEIILVQSPRSSAESQRVCRQLEQEFSQVRLLVQQNNPGLGHAVREGFAAARGNLVLCMDSDGEMENETVPRMLAEMARGGHGLVSGSRWLPGGGFSGYSNLKFYLNWCFQQLFRWLFWTRLTDLTYGFKLLRAELVHGIPWTGTLHEIACETTLKPVRLGISVAEVPTRWTARTQGASKNTFWRNFRYVRMGLSILIHGVPFSSARSAADAEKCPESDADFSPPESPHAGERSWSSECLCN